MTIEDEARRAVEYLTEERGWEPVTSAGDIASQPEHRVWFSVGYAHGEFTFAASQRRGGFGPAIGMTRLRITEALATRFPKIGETLAEALADTADAHEADPDAEIVWPPAVWQDTAV